jgi:trans-2,3-dihydro-3-hydroxyanthranilate isomerase
VLLFTLERGQDDAAAYVRMFSPGFGIAEDPATGSAAGPLGCYLVRYGLMDTSTAERFVVSQGVAMGRPSRLHVEITVEGRDISRVRVGGTSVILGEGVLRL